MKKNSKDLILLEAFKLFATHTYEQVTYNELEKATNLSRGALMYHFKSKEDIFIAVCDKYLINEGSILLKLNDRAIPGMSLKLFIELYLDILREIKHDTNNKGIRNLNLALVNLTTQAVYFYPNFTAKGIEWQAKQIQIWNSVLKQASSNGEVKKDINITILSDLFEDIYCGIAYAGIVYPEGLDVSRLENAFKYVYELIKQ